MANENPFSLTGKKILVTGASSGIGRAIAISASNMGATIFITSRNKENLFETYKLLKPGFEHQLISADLTDQNDIKKLVAEIPPLDGLVNCAGILKKLPLKFLSSKSIDETFSINFKGPALLSQSIYKNKKLQEGASIVFISSIAATQASLGNINYMSSKGALTSFARGVALELAPKKIRVNCILPALVETELVTNALSEKNLNDYLEKFPLGRFGRPEDIANGAIYLLSNASSWVTGTSLLIDGGVTLS